MDSISQLEGDLRQLYMQGDYYREYLRKNLDRLDDLIDVTVLGDTTFYKNGTETARLLPRLRVDDDKMETFFNKIYVFKVIIFSNIKNDLQPQLEKSIRLIDFLEKEYSIK